MLTYQVLILPRDILNCDEFAKNAFGILMGENLPNIHCIQRKLQVKSFLVTQS